MSKDISVNSIIEDLWKVFNNSEKNGVDSLTFNVFFDEEHSHDYGSMEDGKEITLQKDELLEYIKVKENTFKLDKDIFLNENDKVVEVPIYIGSNLRPFISHYRFSKNKYVEDSKQHLKYKISQLSLGPVIQLFMKKQENSAYNRLVRGMSRPWAFRSEPELNIRINKELPANKDEMKESLLYELLNPRLPLFVVKIVEQYDLKETEFYKNYVNSLVFHMNLVNYRRNSYRTVDDLSDYLEGHASIPQTVKKEFSVPKLNYDKKLTDLYSAGNWTDNPFTAFINYYQIIEYFFNKIPDDRLFDVVQSRITSPLFAYSNKDNVMELVKEIYDLRQKDMNELNSLEIVLDHFLDVERLKELLEKDIKNYASSIPSFISGHKKQVCFNINNFNDDRSGNIERLARRIYSIRNSLVHNKDGNQNSYNPQHHYKMLLKEVPLMKAIASIIIINCGEVF
ncbi:MAG TPA: hypothetical protein H9820_07340 [Candidatus Companilactobacillus pullicola]|uniref:Uncharacterized protein n=1 Tax=Candidatus Companilactobacillus pullicola TaxID=2838523 RepID=A0A9D1ZMN2_9LACO|nr:hypothetical protein [Candidatus Companilactobacillus pullicola]